MGNVREQFTATPMGVDETRKIGGVTLGGFLAATTGTLTVASPNPIAGQADLTLINAVPVTAGIYTPLPFFLPTSQGCTVILSDGASGTLAT